MRSTFLMGLVAVVVLAGAAFASDGAFDRGLPRIGTMSGMAGADAVQVTLDRHLWTLSGVIGQDPVALAIDHDGCAISGNAHASSVALTFDWTPERVIYGGTTFGQTVAATVDWKARTLSGFVGDSALRITFDVQAGRVQGQVGAEPTDLQFDAVSGVLKGLWAGRTLRLKLVNLDLFDFLQHFYLFVD